MTCYYYTPRIHRPDAVEVAAIRGEVAAGAKKKDVAAAHGLSVDRLRRLLKRAEAEEVAAAKALGAVEV